jgi:peroxiredoxin
MMRNQWGVSSFVLILIGIFAGLSLGLIVTIILGVQGNFSNQNDILSEEMSFALELGERAPEFSLVTIDGLRINLKDYQGFPVLINFWATWCAPCIEEMPLIQARYELYAPDLKVLAVNSGESFEDVKKFAQQQKLSFTILLDPAEEVQEMYRVRAFPTSYFIDVDGIIRGIHLGSMSGSQLDDYLKETGVGR